MLTAASPLTFKPLVWLVPVSTGCQGAFFALHAQSSPAVRAAALLFMVLPAALATRSLFVQRREPEQRS
jgi:hypothetical protein